MGPYSICYDGELPGTFPTTNTAGMFYRNHNFMTEASFVCDFYDKRTKVSSLVFPTDAIPAVILLSCSVGCVSCNLVAEITCDHSCWDELEMCKSCKKERDILSEESFFGLEISETCN